MVGFAVLGHVARAVVVPGGVGTLNFTNPGSNLPWANVGSIGSASGIYLGNYGGNYWAITASHVGAGDLTLGGTTYGLVPGSAVRVLNNDSSVTDLTLFRIATDPGLATLNLATTAPALNSTVVFVGYGGIETAPGTQLFWQVTNAGATWTLLPDSNGNTNSGFATTPNLGERWGNAHVSGLNTSYDVGTGATSAFYTEFIPSGGFSQGAVGDSGGAAFYFTGGNWYLAGVMGAIAAFNGQPPSTAVFGDRTFSADIASYNSFVTSAIPETSTFAMWIGAAAVTAAGLGRRRRG